jgi:hypothetical protein
MGLKELVGEELIMNIKLFSGVCVAATTLLLAAPALAQVSGSVQAGYDYSTTSLGGQSLNSNGGNVSGNVDMPVFSHWTVQLDGAYMASQGSVSGLTIKPQVVDGELSGFYSAHMGRIGALVGTGQYRETLSAGGSSISENLNATYYGAFGDWYAGDHFTVSARGGGVNANQGLGSSSFYGARLTGYVPHDIALYGTVDYVSFHGSSVSQTNAGVSGEWLVSRQTPFAITAGWTNSKLSEFGSSLTSNVYSIGGKFYFGAGKSLRDHQRDGAESWGATSPLHSMFLF